MNKKCKRIGISGGTFDPIHHGHLIVAEYIMEKLELDKVIFIPSGKPPHKSDLLVTPSKHRYNMVSEAIVGNHNFEVSNIEIERIGNTYTIDTLRELKKIYGSQTEMFFITGADVIRDISTWKDFREVFLLCDFVAALRPNFRKDSFINDIKKLKSEFGARIHVADVPLIDISSTEIRNRIRENKPIRYLVPELVEEYIIKNRLYI